MSITLISLAASLFALTNPIGNMVIFVSMMQNIDKSTARKNALKIMTYTWIGLTITAIVGSQLLKLFGISIAAFSIAGGFLLAHIGFVMTSGEKHKSAQSKNSPHTDPTLVPLTLPLLVGPGAMVAVISFFSTVNIGDGNFLSAWAIITMISALIGICFYSSTYLPKLSTKVTTIINRIMGLIIGSIGIQLILHGIQLFYHIHI